MIWITRETLTAINYNIHSNSVARQTGGAGFPSSLGYGMGMSKLRIQQTTKRRISQIVEQELL